ncbi:MAG: hypothetical protein M9945_09155 [Aquamicrobium sp.]|uniref:hypothetical protein n=1 Tax=Aquamicrobium sp. TaxID=1872579 RepID=UPI00349EAE7E|nr:hypothetical protein [Aquamicrobium sp.]
MAAGKAEAAWAARRALVEGAAATLDLVAAACGLNARALGERAAREGWRVADGAGPTRAERIARVHDRLLDRIEREQLRGENDDAPLDKAGVAELAATARILAKISEITRDEDGAKEKQLERDADIAAILDRLDRQIVDLARHLAAEMAGGDVHGAGAAAGEP